jgi:hypothetical protein
MSDVFLGDLPLWSDPVARELLKSCCEKHGVPMDVLEDLVGIQRNRSGEARARNVYPRIEEVLGRM